MASAEDLIEKLDAVLKAAEELDRELVLAGDEARELIEASAAISHEQAIADFTRIEEGLQTLALPLKELGPEVEKLRTQVEEVSADRKGS